MDRLAQNDANSPKPETATEALDHFLKWFIAEKTKVSVAKGRAGANDRGLESTISKARSMQTVWLRACGDAWPSRLNIAKFREAACREQGWAADYARAQERTANDWASWLRENRIWTERVEFSLTPPGPINPFKKADVAKTYERKGNETGVGGRLVGEDIDTIATKTSERVYAMLFGSESSADFWSVITRKLAHAVGPGNLAKACEVDLHLAETWIRNNRLPSEKRGPFHEAYVLLCVKQLMDAKDWTIDELEDAIDDFGRFILPEDDR